MFPLTFDPLPISTVGGATYRPSQAAARLVRRSRVLLGYRDSLKSGYRCPLRSNYQLKSKKQCHILIWAPAAPRRLGLWLAEAFHWTSTCSNSACGRTGKAMETRSDQPERLIGSTEGENIPAMNYWSLTKEEQRCGAKIINESDVEFLDPYRLVSNNGDTCSYQDPTNRPDRLMFSMSSCSCQ